MANLVNKSRLFNRAWAAYRNSQTKKRSRTFSSCLKWSWKVEKEEAAKQNFKNELQTLDGTRYYGLTKSGKAHKVSVPVTVLNGSVTYKTMFFPVSKAVVEGTGKDASVQIPGWLVEAKESELLKENQYNGWRYSCNLRTV